MRRFVLRFACCIPLFLSLNGSLLAQQRQPSPPIISATKTPPPASSLSVPLPAPVNQSLLSPELARLKAAVQPAVIWVTVFDVKGNPLRTESGFFISADGRFVTTAQAIEGAVNAVAKTGEGGIYNVSGVVASSKTLDLAVLQAEVKPRKLLRFLEINKNAELSTSPTATVVGSALAESEGSPREATITAQTNERLEIAGATPGSCVGAPVVDENGEVIGVVTSAGEKTIARPAAALDSLLSRVATDTQPRWPAVAEAQATPKPTPKPRLIYAPAPAFPAGLSLPARSGTGRFRLIFDAAGNVTHIAVLKSTGDAYFDQAAIKTLGQWKSAPSQAGWEAIVPVTFQAR
jgi:TonB family protein